MITAPYQPWQPWPLRIEGPPSGSPFSVRQFIPGEVLDVRLLPDGRVWVIARQEVAPRDFSRRTRSVPSDGETRLYLFARTGDRWLIDQVVDRVFV